MAKAKKRSSKKPARAKSARRAPPKKKAAPKQAAASGIEALAKKIVRLTQMPSFGAAEVGHAGLEEKLKGWDQMQSGTTWKPRNVWTGRNTVCVEWDSTVHLRDGRTVQLREIDIHEIKNGKIQNERFYYNPMDLAPPQPSLPGV